MRRARPSPVPGEKELPEIVSHSLLLGARSNLAMNTVDTSNARPGAASLAAQDHPPNGPISAPPPRRRGSGFGKVVWLLLLGGLVGGGYYAYTSSEPVRRRIDRTISYVQGHVSETREPSPPAEHPTEIRDRPRWDGLVSIAKDEMKTLGLVVDMVQPQAQPIELELPGRTDYDPNTLSKIRPRFDTLVERVRAELGQHVKKGDPLVDLFSTDLAAAKNDFQTAYVQWQHDVTLRTLREELIKTNAISKQVLVDTRNDENKSRLALSTARQKLRVFEVPEDQIERLVRNLDPTKVPSFEQMGDVVDKARMTRLSPVDGIVIARDAVPGNLYDNNDVLMVIAPLDHLFVWVNVYEADQVKVKKGQDMVIRFPYLNETVMGTVQYVAPEVSKDTRAIKIRATVPNIDGKLKSDMLVRARLEVLPVSGWTTIPRLAMVVMNGHEYAFVQDDKSSSQGVEKFERRPLEVAEEREDHVVVAKGLRPGERVATNGSLILAQLYEDQQMVATGMPLK
jgi:membrane fusion protein, heavy metal efflux system